MFTVMFSGGDTINGGPGGERHGNAYNELDTWSQMRTCQTSWEFPSSKWNNTIGRGKYCFVCFERFSLSIVNMIYYWLSLSKLGWYEIEESHTNSSVSTLKTDINMGKRIITSLACLGFNVHFQKGQCWFQNYLNSKWMIFVICSKCDV